MSIITLGLGGYIITAGLADEHIFITFDELPEGAIEGIWRGRSSRDHRNERIDNYAVRASIFSVNKNEMSSNESIRHAAFDRHDKTTIRLIDVGVRHHSDKLVIETSLLSITGHDCMITASFDAKNADDIIVRAAPSIDVPFTTFIGVRKLRTE